jgi:uroporphyrinogen decarboxylase
MLSSKELVYAALKFNQIPRVPYAIDFTLHAQEKFVEASAGRELFMQLDNDILATPVIRIQFGARDDTGHYQDEFGVVWDRRMDPDIGIPRSLITPETLLQYNFPDPYAEGRFDPLVENIQNHPNKLHVMTLSFSLYERAWSLRGMEDLLVDMIENEEFVGKLLDRILQFNLNVINAGLIHWCWCR